MAAVLAEVIGISADECDMITHSGGIVKYRAVKEGVVMDACFGAIQGADGLDGVP